MDEYWDKLEALSVLRLEMLVKRYQKSIQGLELRLREATIVAMTADIKFCQQELDRKRSELAQIEKLLAVKKQETKKEQA